MHPMIGALGLAFVLRWAAFYVANQIDKSTIYIPILYAIPIVTSLVSIIFLNMHKRLAMPLVVRNRTSTIWKRAQKRVLAATGRTGGGTAR